MQTRLRQPAERAQQRRRVRRQAVDHVAGAARRLSIERVPAGEESFADGQALGSISLGGRSREEDSGARGADTTANPSPRVVAEYSAHGIAWKRAMASRTISSVVVVDDLLPGDQLARQIGHQDRDRVAVRTGPEIGRDQRLDEPHLATRHDSFAKGDIARGADDPVPRCRGPLQDEPFVAAGDRRQARAGPTVIGEVLLGQPAEPELLEELAERPRSPASAGSRHVERAVRATVDVDDVRVGAVASHHDAQRLGVRGVRLDVDLAGRDVDEVPGTSVEPALDCRSARTYSSPPPRRCRSRSRSRRGDGRASGRRGRSTPPPNRAARRRPSGRRWRSSAPCRRAGRSSFGGRRAYTDSHVSSGRVRTFDSRVILG